MRRDCLKRAVRGAVESTMRGTQRILYTSGKAEVSHILFCTDLTVSLSMILGMVRAKGMYIRPYKPSAEAYANFVFQMRYAVRDGALRTAEFEKRNSRE